jgi:hypothetical protein
MKRSSLSQLILLSVYLLTVTGAIAQQADNITDPVYGTDPLLINGKYYTFFLPSNTDGNQYFASPLFETGSATVRGVTYAGILINYDVYNQQLILNYENNIGAHNLITLSDAWLENFSFRGFDFELIAFQDSLKKIYQVMGDGQSRILYYWTKDLVLDSFHGAKNHTFSRPKREMNILTGTQIIKYLNNKSFCSAFESGKRTEIKEYLQRNHVKVKKALDPAMTDVINYCNSLSIK